ncbi:MAG TPA: hypothetical protein P5081_00030 [Phycisphaerae bacterium]|nr:hypothetical protein [Phycisphaerae bacterium]HRW51240.1 hypothetical protein [Phycisphaerae bacterium]
MNEISEKQAERFHQYYASTITWMRVLQSTLLLCAIMLGISSGSKLGLEGVESFVGGLFGAGAVSDPNQFFIWAPRLLFSYALFFSAVYSRRLHYRNICRDMLTRSKNAGSDAALLDFNNDTRWLVVGDASKLEICRWIRLSLSGATALAPLIAYTFVRFNVGAGKLREVRNLRPDVLSESSFSHYVLLAAATIALAYVVKLDYRSSKAVGARDDTQARGDSQKRTRKRKRKRKSGVPLTKDISKKSIPDSGQAHALFEHVQDKLVKWSQRTVLVGVILGSVSVWGVVQAAVSSVRETTIEARLAAKSATDEAKNARKFANDTIRLEKELGDLQSKLRILGEKFEGEADRSERVKAQTDRLSSVVTATQSRLDRLGPWLRLANASPLLAESERRIGQLSVALVDATDELRALTRQIAGTETSESSRSQAERIIDQICTATIPIERRLDMAIWLLRLIELHGPIRGIDLTQCLSAVEISEFDSPEYRLFRSLAKMLLANKQADSLFAFLILKTSTNRPAGAPAFSQKQIDSLQAKRRAIIEALISQSSIDAQTAEAMSAILAQDNSEYDIILRFLSDTSPRPSISPEATEVLVAMFHKALESATTEESVGAIARSLQIIGRPAASCIPLLNHRLEEFENRLGVHRDSLTRDPRNITYEIAGYGINLADTVISLRNAVIELQSPEETSVGRPGGADKSAWPSDGTATTAE